MKDYSLIILLSLFLFKISLAQYHSFMMELEPGRERCLSEYYKSQTVVIFELTSNTPGIQLEVKSPDGRILYHHNNYTSLCSITTKSNGFYSVCAKNYARLMSEIQLSIKSGVNANDLSSVAKSKDLEPIDYELDKIIQKSPILDHFNKVSLQKQEQFSNRYKSISHKIILYSLLMIVGMVVIGVIETLYLKRFMEKRKII